MAVQAAEVAKWMLKAIAGKPDNRYPSLYDLRSRSLRTGLDCSAAKQVLGWQPNADLEIFLKEAIGCHLRPTVAGDLRLLRPMAAGAQSGPPAAISMP